jgi:hypothetical protein
MPIAPTSHEQLGRVHARTLSMLVLRQTWRLPLRSICRTHTRRALQTVAAPTKVPEFGFAFEYIGTPAVLPFYHR